MNNPKDYMIICWICAKAHEPFSYDNAVAWMQSHLCYDDLDPYHNPPST